MAGVITTGNKPRLLLPGITRTFGLEYEKFKGIGQTIYEQMASQRNFEEMVQIVGGGAAEHKTEGAPINTDTIDQGYARRTVHKVWAKAFRITKEAFDDDLYLSHANVLAKEMAKALFHAKEANAAALFNNCTSTSAPYLGADGKAYYASDHPLGRGGVLDNLASVAISELALEQADIDIRGWQDNSGRPAMAKIKKLLVPRQLIPDVHRILQSDRRSGTADNDANYLKDKGIIPSVEAWIYLTDVDAWHLLTDQAGLMQFNRTGTETDVEQEPYTKDKIYSMTERYSFDYYDPRAGYGSAGA